MHNGASINFWDDWWIPTVGEFKIKSPKPVNNSVSLVKDVINSTLKDWDHRKISSLVSHEEHDAIARIPISMEDKADALIWYYNSLGSYTVKFGYQCALRLTADPPATIPSSSTQWCESDWKFVWSLNLSSKLKHFVWRVCNNFLATKQNLHHRHCSTSDLCQVYSQSSESIEHVFFGCAWTKAVWFGSGLGIRVELQSILFFQQWFGDIRAQMTEEESCKPLLCRVFWLCWSIWKARNAYIFNHEPVDPFHIIAKANWEESEFIAARASSPVQTGVSDRVRSSSIPKWIPPARGLLKVNCDAAFHPMSSKGAIAVLLRDDRGRLVDGLAREVVLSSASQGEALAIHLACLMVSSPGLSSVEVEGDNKRVIHLCVSEDAPHWEFSTVITVI